jgi:hypothetical protein
MDPGICLTTEGKARKNLSQGSRRDSKNAHYQDPHTIQNSLKPPQYGFKNTRELLTCTSHWLFYLSVHPSANYSVT